MSQTEHRPFIFLITAHFLTFLIVGLPLPVLPLFVHNTLGHSTAVAGFSIGVHFLATVLFRGAAGRLADTWGGKHTTMAGALICACSGIPYILAASSLLPPDLQLPCIILGRACLGIGHSMAGTGALAWGFGLIGPQHAGRVISWAGIAMYTSIAFGAPVGLMLWEQWGIAALGIASLLLAACSLACLGTIPEIPVVKGERKSGSGSIFPRILRPGICLALHGVGNAVIGAFISLYFDAQGWGHAGFALSCFGLSFVVVRIFGGELPDKMPGRRLTLISLATEALGLVCIAAAASPALAFVGVSLTGLGCSLVYPSIGVDLVRSMPLRLRGTAVGWFTAFQDISYGLTGPLTGLLVPGYGYASVFFTGSACAILGFIIVLVSGGPERVPSEERTP